MATSALGLNATQFGGPVTTEWDDTLRKHGIIPPLEPDEPVEEAPAEAPAPPPPSSSTEEEESEEAELVRLRAERLAEMKTGQSGGRFGSVQPLSHADYVAEVNQAGEGVGVVVFLFTARHYMSAYTLVLMERLARKHADVKFLQIEATECMPGYPKANLPTAFAYRDDDLLGQLVGSAAFGGTSFGIEEVEAALRKTGVLDVKS